MKTLSRILGWPIALIVTFAWFGFWLLGAVATAIDYVAGYGMDASAKGVYRGIEMISGAKCGEEER